MHMSNIDQNTSMHSIMWNVAVQGSPQSIQCTHMNFETFFTATFCTVVQEIEKFSPFLNDSFELFFVQGCLTIFNKAFIIKPSTNPHQYFNLSTSLSKHNFLLCIIFLTHCSWYWLVWKFLSVLWNSWIITLAYYACPAMNFCWTIC